MADTVDQAPKSLSSLSLFAAFSVGLETNHSVFSAVLTAGGGHVKQFWPARCNTVRKVFFPDHFREAKPL